MAIFEKLSMINDIRKDENSCDFNGYLEDYLQSELDVKCKDLLSKIQSLNSNFKVCINLGFNVNPEVISNQIIRYKDSLKIPEKSIRCPIILYIKIDDLEKGIILDDGGNYLLAKGYYFCLTEQYAMLQDSRNEIVALSSDNETLVLEKIEKFLKPEVKAGAIQREVDNYYFKNAIELAELAEKYGHEVVDAARNKIPKLEDRTSYIYETVSKWYLLKKLVYVSYMTSKNILEKEHEGNIKKQRFAAKNLSDKIPFIIFSEMWRMPKE